MSEFTKDKWTADEYGGYVFAHGADMMICQMRGAGYLRKQGLSDEEIIAVQGANARLIAAAPEMYELLKVVANYKPNFVWDVVFHAQELLARIDGEESEHE